MNLQGTTLHVERAAPHPVTFHLQELIRMLTHLAEVFKAHYLNLAASDEYNTTFSY